MSDVLLAVVLDKSGSMGGLESATKEGLNSLFAEQRALEGKVLLSLTLFDTNFDVRFVATDLSEVPDLGSDGNLYSANGGTALYDAVAVTIKGIDEWLLNHREFTGKVLCVINTDGEENSSKTTTLDQVNDLINQKQTQGWEFAFMGVGQAAWTEGQKFAAIPASNYHRSTNDMAGVGASYASVSTSVIGTRTTGASFSNANNPDEIITGVEPAGTVTSP